jgi:hypothetical protein
MAIEHLEQLDEHKRRLGLAIFIARESIDPAAASPWPNTSFLRTAAMKSGSTIAAFTCGKGQAVSKR